MDIYVYVVYENGTESKHILKNEEGWSEQVLLHKIDDIKNYLCQNDSPILALETINGHDIIRLEKTNYISFKIQ